VQSGASYNHETVVLDGEAFSNCTFQSCRMVYAGGGAPTFDACRFVDCEWKFEAAAAETLACLQLMWTAGAKPAVQSMIKDITAVGR
jgi:hypothetical protein